MYCGARKAAAELGGDVTVTIQGSDSIAAEDEMLVFDAVVATEPDGIILVPYDSQAFIEPVRRQMAAGIQIVTADGSLDEPGEIFNIRTDNSAGGGILAEHMAEAVPDDAVIGVISASPTDTVQNVRAEAFIARFTELKPNATLLPMEYARQDASIANSITAAWLLAHPDLAGVFTASGLAAEGAASAIEAAGLTGQIEVYTYDAFDTVVASLRAGGVSGILAQSPFTQGYEGAKVLIQVLRGELDAATVEYQQYSPLAFIDMSNIDSDEAFPFLQDKAVVCDW
jgi:ribose transport system substrate-binding protein